MDGSKATTTYCSKRQGCAARSATEAEYVAISTACQVQGWLKRLLRDILKDEDNPRLFYENNQETIELPRIRSFTVEHIVRKQVENKLISVKYCRTANILAHIMRKEPLKFQFEKFRIMLRRTKHC